MLLLTILASFGMFTVVILIGIAIGYALGYKNDYTLKQQISKLKATVKRQNKSAQLRELTPREQSERDNWDLRVRLAELTGAPVTSAFDTPHNDDPNSISNTF